MTETQPKHPMTLQRIVYRLDGMEAVPVQRDMEYHAGDAGAQVMDIYRPPSVERGTRVPVVVLVVGFPDVGVTTPLGCAFKDIEMAVSLAQLIAMSGMVAVTYTTSRPAADLGTVLDYLVRHGETLGLASTRLGLWAASGHVPVALSALMRGSQPPIAAAVLSNGFTLDLEGSAVADAAQQFRFANPCDGKSVEDVSPEVALLMVRSGKDQFAGLNAAMDRFVSAALRHNLPLTLVNSPMAPHAFELNADNEESRAVIRQMLTFLQVRLLG